MAVKKLMKRAIRMPSNVKALWGTNMPKSRGPKPAHSPEQIARTAIGVADAEGMDAVSMQRIARAVGVTTMALYRYFSSKEELIDRMIETAGGLPPKVPSGSQGWRTCLTEWTRACVSIYREHPWFLQAATARRRVMGPNELAWLDTALSALSEAGLSGREQLDAFLVLMGHVRSHAEFSAGEAKGLSAEDWVRITTELAGNHCDRYPALMEAIESGAFTEEGADGVDFGLECILEGIESLTRGKRSKRNAARSKAGKLH
ncbi:MAG: TetR/AcrR family transcriptional regulator [Terracidiphilus sp.]